MQRRALAEERYVRPEALLLNYTLIIHPSCEYQSLANYCMSCVRAEEARESQRLQEVQARVDAKQSAVASVREECQVVEGQVG